MSDFISIEKASVQPQAAEATTLSESSFSAYPLTDITIDHIDKLIKQGRKAKGLSQKALSARIGITNVQLSRIENGDSLPSVSTLTKLAPILGYSMEELLIASNYQGKLPSSTPTYLDLNGEIIDLKPLAQTMYRTDAELLLLLWDFFQNYTASDGKLLKIVTRSIIECQKAANEDTTPCSQNDFSSVETESDSAALQKDSFVSAFSDLKQFLFSFDQIAHLQL